MGMSKKELEYLILPDPNRPHKKALATAESLTVRELTEAEINLMPTLVYEWHAAHNTANLEKALAPKPKERPTPPAFEAQKELAERLFRDYPQLLRTPENATVIDGFLSSMASPTFSYQDFITAFETETMSGRLVLNPSACGVGEETLVTGHRLRTHPELYKLLRPAPTDEQQAQLEQDQMSSKDWAKLHAAEWRGKSEREIEAEQWVAAIPEFKRRHPEYNEVASPELKDAIMNYIKNLRLPLTVESIEQAWAFLGYGSHVEGVVTNYVNYGPQPTGLPESGNENLNYKVRSMNSRQYDEWVRNPANRKAVENMAQARR